MTLSSIRDYCTLTICLLCAACSRPEIGAGQINVAAAADLQFALPEIVAAFQQSNPRIHVSVAYGSSGNFYAQIRNGAPFDVFLSADSQFPHWLAQEKLVRGSPVPYAVGRIAVWVPANSPLDLDRLGIHALEAPAVKHVAIANPQHAPYGRAAEAALRSLGVYDRVAPRFVLGENIAQTLEFVESGAADAGIVALSLAAAPAVRAKGRYWEVPPSAYPPIEQAGVVLSRAREPRAAAGFLNFLGSSSAASILTNYGFAVRGRS